MDSMASVMSPEAVETDPEHGRRPRGRPLASSAESWNEGRLLPPDLNSRCSTAPTMGRVQDVGVVRKCGLR